MVSVGADHRTPAKWMANTRYYAIFPAACIQCSHFNQRESWLAAATSCHLVNRFERKSQRERNE